MEDYVAFFFHLRDVDSALGPLLRLHPGCSKTLLCVRLGGPCPVRQRLPHGGLCGLHLRLLLVKDRLVCYSFREAVVLPEAPNVNIDSCT